MIHLHLLLSYSHTCATNYKATHSDYLANRFFFLFVLILRHCRTKLTFEPLTPWASGSVTPLTMQTTLQFQSHCAFLMLTIENIAVHDPTTGRRLHTLQVKQTTSCCVAPKNVNKLLQSRRKNVKTSA